jgi:hypothetical protein
MSCPFGKIESGCVTGLKNDDLIIPILRRHHVKHQQHLYEIYSTPAKLASFYQQLTPDEKMIWDQHASTQVEGLDILTKPDRVPRYQATIENLQIETPPCAL